MFESNRREKRGWSTDYPGADLNFSTRLAELTKAPVTMRPDAEEGDAPDAVVVRLTDDALFNCPYLLMQDAGTADFSAAEARRLRDYLLKGGFLFVSDYWGELAREQFDEQIGLALPPRAISNRGYAAQSLRCGTRYSSSRIFRRCRRFNRGAARAAAPIAASWIRHRRAASLMSAAGSWW